MVRRDAQRALPRYLQHASEKAARRGTVAVFTKHRVEQLTSAIDRSVQVAPAAGDLHVRLVDVPGPPRPPATARAKVGADERCESEFPGADGLVCHLVASLQQQFGDVPQPEFVAEAPEYGEQHDVRRKLQLIERRAGALVEATMAIETREPSVSEGRSLLLPTDPGRFAVRTGHRRAPRLRWTRLHSNRTSSSDGTSEHRDQSVARRFLRRLVEVSGHRPLRVTTDHHGSYPKAIRWICGRKAIHRRDRYLNNRTEQSHRVIPLKQRYYPMLGFGNFESASRFCTTFDELHNYFRNEGLMPPAERRSLFMSRWRELIKNVSAA